MNILPFFQAIIKYLLYPTGWMEMMWIPVITMTLILAFFVLIKISSFLEYQKNNLLVTGLALIICYSALLQVLFTSPNSALPSIIEGVSPQNIRTFQVGPNEQIIQWDTRRPDIQSVEYTADGKRSAVAFQYVGMPLTTHIILLRNLQTRHHYIFKIIYKDKELYSFDGKPLEFTLH